MMMMEDTRRSGTKKSLVGSIIRRNCILRRLCWVPLMHHNCKPKVLNLINVGSRSRPINKPNLNPSDHPEYYSADGDGDGDGDGKELLIGGESLLSDGKGKAVVQVPRGYLAVYVGPELQRYVIPACYLSMPEFKELMEKAAEEFGYQHDGGLSIPNCEEDDFEVILTRCLAMHQPTHKKNPSKTIQL
ncbi:hypothetical protein LOK49_LG14G02267 [Camellia lanceoleosa]|uniref:Uncharacterized protein n=1 Tax=Camellia lanceoleosa TaxID=1840588 RepID=A0ACC0FE53_9ERIC|nr:hypothetical protein LOK49_LG14G02267 [Camellia lanceoleosa]